MSLAVHRRTPTLLNAFSEPKSVSAKNEDSFAVSDDGLRYAVSDGASISFDSATWSTILAKRYLLDSQVDNRWISEALGEYVGLHNREDLPWMMQAAFDRGSFASLIGLSIQEDGSEVEVVCVGDSAFALFDGSNMIEFLPYSKPEEFDSSPILISTNPAENSWFADEDANVLVRRIQLVEFSRPHLLMMTDALARWLLEGPADEKFERLSGLSNQASFSEFVVEERAKGSLARDDTTMVLIELV